MRAASRRRSPAATSISRSPANSANTCGTHIATRRPDLPFVILKIGTLDDPALYGGPQMAIYTVDKQPFHIVPEGLPAFERLPPR